MSAVEKNTKIVTPPKAYPAGRRWGKSLARLRWEAEQRGKQPEQPAPDRIREWDNAMHRIFKGIYTRVTRHELISDAVARNGKPPAWLVANSDPSNPKGQPKPNRRAR